MTRLAQSVKSQRDQREQLYKQRSNIQTMVDQFTQLIGSKATHDAMKKAQASMAAVAPKIEEVEQLQDDLIETLDICKAVNGVLSGDMTGSGMDEGGVDDLMDEFQDLIAEEVAIASQTRIFL